MTGYGRRVSSRSEPKTTRQPTRRGELNKELILSAGLQLLDAEGLEALSMRRISDELGVTPMALYRHVGTKEEIVDGLADLALNPLDTEPAQDAEWHEQIREIFASVHDSFIEHPGLVEILLRRPVTANRAVRAIERLLRILCSAGFDGREAVGAIAALASFTFGFTLQQRTHARSAAEQANRLRTLRQLPREEFPHTIELAEDFANWSTDEQFTNGLALLIDGLRTQLARREGKPDLGTG
jgi:AcrR family transcriptional regulator